MINTPTMYFLVSGNAEGFSSLNAFDSALINAGIGDTNLVKLSSILPPRCKLIPKVVIQQGSLVPVAYASMISDVRGERISSAVAIGIPVDDEQAGLIMEYSARDTEENVRRRVSDMVMEGMSFRRREIKGILVESTSRVINKVGATFAAVVLL